ncbi:MAG: alpha/beta hydrolase-fold protein [Planctomycetota bacterium]
MNYLFVLKKNFFGFFFGASLIWGQITQVVVHYEVGDGNFLAIRGSSFPLSWEEGQSCVIQESSTWIWTSTTLQDSTEFKILWNDQVWSIGANYKLDPGARCDVYPFFGKNRGLLLYLPRFWSPELNNERTLRIYLPPSYFENKRKRYPVLYVQDGQNLFDRETSALGVDWELDETLDRLILKGEMDEVLVVGIDNTGRERLFEYTTPAPEYLESGGSERYGRFLRKTLISYINQHYRTLTSPANTAIMGSSLGGLISLEIAWTEPFIFGKIAALSGSFWWNQEECFSRVKLSNNPKKKLQIYLDSGTIEDGLTETQKLAENLRTQGYHLLFYKDEGGRHQEFFWGKRVGRPLTFFFPFQSTDYSSPVIFKESPSNE